MGINAHMLLYNWVFNLFLIKIIQSDDDVLSINTHVVDILSIIEKLNSNFSSLIYI